MRLILQYFFLSMNPLFWVVVLVPIVSHFQPVQARWGVELDILFFWKDKVLWILSFLALYMVRSSSPWVITFWGFLFYSTLFSVDLGQSVWGMSNYSEGAITFFCYSILFLASESLSEKSFNKAISASVFLMGFLGLIQILYGNFLSCPPLKYLSGLEGMQTNGITLPLYMTLANPNHLGLYCALLFPVFIRLPNYFFSTILVGLAAGSGSRGAWLSMLIMLPRRFWKWLVPVGLLVLTYFFSTTLHNKLSLTMSGRDFIWKNSWNLLHLMGRGAATFALDFPQDLVAKSGVLWPPGTIIDRPHNMLIQITHATGLLSLIPLGVLLWKSVKEESIYRYGIFGFLIAGLFTDSMVGVTPIFAVMLGLCYFKD